jgi:small-conductance mechanosensitive channel
MTDRGDRAGMKSRAPTVPLAVWICLGALSPSSVPAQEATPAGYAESRREASLEAAHGLAAVTVDSRALFYVRGLASYPAADRARAISERIVRAARERTFAADTLRLAEVDLGTQILAGELPLLTVTDGDAEIEGVPKAQLAGLYLLRVRQAIETYRIDRSPERLRTRGAYAAAATLLFAGALVLLRWLRRHAGAALERRYSARVSSLKFQSVEFIQAERIWGVVRGFFRFLSLLIAIALGLAYLEGVLSLLPWTRGVAESLLDYVLDPLRTMAGAIVGFIPELLFLLMLTLVTRYLLKITRFIAEAVAQGSITLGGFDPEWTWPTYKILRLVALIFAVVVAYPYIPGSDSLAFKGVSLFIGILFSLGSSSVIGNLLAGYSMTYRRAFKVGDRIQVEDVVGEVLETRVLVTHLRSPKNEEIIVPNSVILGGKVVNYSSLARKSGLILHTTVGIGYEVPWRQVEAMLLQAAERTPGLLKEPRPFVLQRALGDFAITYELNVYTDSPQAMILTYAELHRRILDVFNEYGVQIMTPAYEGDPAEPKVVPREQWHAPPAPQRDPPP